MDISADKLKQLRIERGLSQELLAKQSGLSLRTIQRLEQAGGGSPESLLSLSAALNVSPQAIRIGSLTPITPWSFAQRFMPLSAIILLMALLVFIINLAAQGQFSIYIDVVSFIFLLIFIPCATLVAAGKTGFFASIRNLALLWQPPTGTIGTRHFLNHLYRLQYRLCYSGAFLLSLLGFISLTYHSSHIGLDQLQGALSVLGLIWLYAACFAELVLRPILFKLRLSLELDWHGTAN